MLWLNYSELIQGLEVLVHWHFSCFIPSLHSYPPSPCKTTLFEAHLPLHESPNTFPSQSCPPCPHPLTPTSFPCESVRVPSQKQNQKVHVHMKRIIARIAFCDGSWVIKSEIGGSGYQEGQGANSQIGPAAAVNNRNCFFLRENFSSYNLGSGSPR